MRKSIGIAWVQWLFLLLLLVLLVFFRGNGWIFPILITWIMLPVVSWLCNRWIKKYLSISLKIEPNVSKGKITKGTLNMENTGILSVFRLFVRLRVRNRLTEEENELYIPASVLQKSKTKTTFSVCAEHCGYVDLTADTVYLMDWFGILPYKVQLEGKKHMAVLPDTFEPHVYIQVSAEQSEEAENWSQIKKGRDQSELFALREYVPGDNIKQIHWKLSAKKNQTIIRESSLPIEKSLLLFWNKNTKADSPKAVDAMAEAVASMGQNIINQGIPFVMGWTEGSSCIYENIDYEVQFLQTVPRMLKQGADTDAGTEYVEAMDQFSKVILFTGSLPQTDQIMENPRITVILCGQKSTGELQRVITFGADTYMEDLQNIEV